MENRTTAAGLATTETTLVSSVSPISVVVKNNTIADNDTNDDDELSSCCVSNKKDNFDKEKEEDCNCVIYGKSIPIPTKPIQPKLVYDTTTTTTRTTKKAEGRSTKNGLEKLFFWNNKKETKKGMELAGTTKTNNDGCCSDGLDDDDSDKSASLVLSVPDAVSCPVVLTMDLFLELSLALPWSLQHRTWERCFCIARDGDSIQHMLRLCQPYHQTLLVVQTTKGQVFGAFCTGKWQLSTTQSRKNGTYYGNGQSFLFSCHNQKASIYKWSGKNEYCQLCQLEQNRIAMGGDGDFGLILEDNFSKGHTGYCATYANPPLVQENDGHFQIQAMELYGAKPFSLLF